MLEKLWLMFIISLDLLGKVLLILEEHRFYEGVYITLDVLGFSMVLYVNLVLKHYFYKSRVLLTFKTLALAYSSASLKLIIRLSAQLGQHRLGHGDRE